MRQRLGGIFLCFTLFVPAGSQDVTSSPSDSGGAIYTACCAACHGDNGDGRGAMADELARAGAPPADLTTWILQDSRSDEKLRQAVRGGGAAVHRSDSMPAWSSTLTDSQVDDVVAYVRGLKVGAAPALANVEPLDDEMQIGRALYSIRCLPCHGGNGSGDGFLLDSLQAPADLRMPDFRLSSTFAERSDDRLQAVVASGISHSGLTLQTSTGWWNRALTLSEMRALTRYLRSLPLDAASQP